MTSRLDDMLEPGERVVYRARCSLSVASLGLHSLWAALVAGVAVALLLRLWQSPESSLRGLVLVLLLPVAAWGLAWVVVRTSTAALVTNQRVIASCGQHWTGAAAIPLAEIRALARLPMDELEIRRQDGDTVIVAACSRPDEFARVVAQASAVTQPYFPGAKERLVGAVAVAVGIAVVVLGFSSVLVIILGWSGPAGDPYYLLLGAALFAGFAATHFAALSLGGLAAVAVARAFMSAGEARLWLCRDIEARSWLSRSANALALRFASRLYGQAIQCEKDGAERHGG